jgi:hypothetical protein
MAKILKGLAGAAGFEPATYGFGDPKASNNNNDLLPDRAMKMPRFAWGDQNRSRLSARSPSQQSAITRRHRRHSRWPRTYSILSGCAHQGHSLPLGGKAWGLSAWVF